MREISEAALLSVKRLKHKGLTVAEIAERHNLSIGEVKQIINGKSLKGSTK